MILGLFVSYLKTLYIGELIAVTVGQRRVLDLWILGST